MFIVANVKLISNAFRLHSEWVVGQRERERERGDSMALF